MLNLSGILRYSLSAAAFGVAATLIWLAVRLARGKRRFEPCDVRRALTVFYLATLVQITALRLGLAPLRPLGNELKLVPLKTTRQELALGTWPFIYHTLGNLLWFVPLGLLMGWRRPQSPAWRALAAGALLSLAVEAVQFLLGTGVADVDDVLLNALGALLGRALYTLAARRR